MKFDNIRDNYWHYREQVGCGIFLSLWRAIVREWTGKEPWND